MPLYIIYTYIYYIYVIIQHRIYSSFNPLETFRHWVKPPSFELQPWTPAAVCATAQMTP